MEKPTGQEFFARLLEALRDADLPTTQTSVAEFLGINQSAVAKWKSGESFPEFDNVVRLASRARVSIPWLYLGVGNKKSQADMDDQTLELLRAWDRMPKGARDELLNFVRFRASLADQRPDADEPPSKANPSAH